MKTQWLWILVCLLMFGMGIILGMLWGTYAVIDHVAYGLSGSTFIVNLNETKLVDESMKQFNQTILPYIVTKRFPNTSSIYIEEEQIEQ